jgi:hypothetical protein
MATVVNARDIAIDGTAHVTVTIPGSLGWSSVTDDNGNKPTDNADPTQDTIVTGITVTGGGITLSSGGAIKGGQTGYATGTGWFLGYSGGAYKFSIGDASHYLRWDGSAMTFAGNLTGAGDITWTGTAKFDGATTSGGLTASVVINESQNTDYGLYAQGKNSGAGLRGDAVGSSAFGVWGHAGTGTGLKGDATTGTALDLSVTTGKLMKLSVGKFSTGANTPSLTNCPGSGTAYWVEVYDSAGTKYYLLAVKDT